MVAKCIGLKGNRGSSCPLMFSLGIANTVSAPTAMTAMKPQIPNANGIKHATTPLKSLDSSVFWGWLGPRDVA